MEEIALSQFEATQLQTRSLLKIGHQVGMVLLPGFLAFLSGPEMDNMQGSASLDCRVVIQANRWAHYIMQGVEEVGFDWNLKKSR